MYSKITQLKINMQPISAHRYKKKSCSFDVRVGETVVFHKIPDEKVYMPLQTSLELKAEVVNCSPQTFEVKPIEPRKWRRIRKGDALFLNPSKWFRFVVLSTGLRTFELRINDDRAESYRIRQQYRDELKQLPLDIERSIRKLQSPYFPGDIITFRGFGGEIKQWKVDKYFDVKLDNRPGIYGVMSLDADDDELREYYGMETWTDRNEKIYVIRNNYFDVIGRNRDKMIILFLDEKILTGLFDDPSNIDEYLYDGIYEEKLAYFWLPLMIEGKIKQKRVQLETIKGDNGDHIFIISRDNSLFDPPIDVDPRIHLNFPNAEPLPETYYWFGPYIVQALQSQDDERDWKYYLSRENIGFVQKPISRPSEPMKWYSDTLGF